MPARILDLYAEFRNHVNGSIGDRGLIAAMNYFGLDAMSVVHKQQMVDLILAGGPWTDQERADIFDYCAGDTNALERLLPVMLPQIDLPRALLRGRYMAAASAMEWNGVPIDMATLELLRTHWNDIKDRLITDIDADFGVYEGINFRENLFEQLLVRLDIPWERLESGRLCLQDDVWREMARAYPIISPLRELRHALSDLRLNDLSVGDDGQEPYTALGLRLEDGAQSAVEFQIHLRPERVAARADQAAARIRRGVYRLELAGSRNRRSAIR